MKGSYVADEIIREYKREQYFKKKAEEKKKEYKTPQEYHWNVKKQFDV